MGGSVPFDVALEERLKLIKPSKGQLADCLAHHQLTLTPGTLELVRCLQQQGKVVFLVSGGFSQMIEPVASALGIPAENVVANRLLFDDGARARAPSIAFVTRRGCIPRAPRPPRLTRSLPYPPVVPSRRARRPCAGRRCSWRLCRL
jgi:hypothetical protein